MGRTEVPGDGQAHGGYWLDTGGGAEFDAVELSHRAGDAQALNMVMMGPGGGGYASSAERLEEDEALRRCGLRHVVGGPARAVSHAAWAGRDGEFLSTLRS